MTLEPQLAGRLEFLVRVVRKECRHLGSTDRRLFNEPFTAERAANLENDLDLAERVEAFVSRFGRLQDTLGDKLLPVLLQALGEKPRATIDNLDRAERLGLIESADRWMALRKLRNQMVHEYIEDLTVLIGALDAGHQAVPVLMTAADNMLAEIERRGWGQASTE